MKISRYLQFLENINTRPVADIEVYNQRMNAALFDKMFFIGKVKFDCLVDFGCADGVLLEKLNRVSPDVDLFGFDINKDEVGLAKAKLKNKAFISDSWKEILEKIKNYNSPTLCLSSVIHEVYSYTENPNLVEEFWKKCVFGGNFKYIVLRDMITSDDIDDVSDYKSDVLKVNSKVNSKYVKSFESIWGKLEDSYRQFTHFLLKYKYIGNWNRAVHENYLPLTISELKKQIPPGYEVVYENSFILPYTQEQVNRDFGIKLKKPTHTKMIIKKYK